MVSLQYQGTLPQEPMQAEGGHHPPAMRGPLGASTLARRAEAIENIALAFTKTPVGVENSRAFRPFAEAMTHRDTAPTACKDW
jgi:hypothetical protein